MTDNVWPMPVFYFRVEIAGQQATFKEVSGLDSEAQPIEYRHGNDPGFSKVKMPGLSKTSHVTLKKGIFKADSALWDYFNQIKLNTIRRENVVISLLDEQGTPTMSWNLCNAWPTKVSGVSLRPDGNEVAVETLELAHEGCTIANP